MPTFIRNISLKFGYNSDYNIWVYSGFIYAKKRENMHIFMWARFQKHTNILITCTNYMNCFTFYIRMIGTKKSSACNIQITNIRILTIYP